MDKKSCSENILFEELERMHETLNDFSKFTKEVSVEMERNKAILVEKIVEVKDEINDKVNIIHIKLSNDITELKVKLGVWGALGALVVLLLAGFFGKLWES